MDKPLNVVWFCTDQQRWDTVHALGNPAIHTPAMDRLAREGVAGGNAYTQAPICTPSRASFLTGRYPRTTRMFYNGNDKCPKDEVLVTKYMADRGYTCGLSGKLHLSSARGRMEERLDDGYSFMRWSHHPHDDWEKGVNNYQDWLKEQGVDWKKAYGGRYTSMAQWPPVENEGFSGKEVGIEAQYHQTTWCVNEAIEFIEGCKDKTAPWLISINTFDPHPPLDPPQAYKDRLKIEDMPLPLWKEGELEKKPPHQQHDYVAGGQNGATDSIIGMTEEDKREKFRDYYAEIELIDDQLGRLMDYLDKNNLRDNTLVIFMSDHGEMNGDHGLYWKGAYFYEGLVHVPLIMSCPGLIQKGVVSQALVELVDIAPTILDMAGLEIPYYMQGKSLYPLLRGETKTHKDSVYCEFYSCLTGCHDDLFGTMYFDGRYKLVVFHGKEFGELYDLQEDPHEFNNLWDDPAHEKLKNELIRKDFDNAVMRNMDFSLNKLYSY